MKKFSIRWQLSISYAAIALLAALLLGGIMLMILTRYYAIQEVNYLNESAGEIGDKIFYNLQEEIEDLSDEEIEGLLERFAFYLNARIRLLDENQNVVLDSGMPEPTLNISISDEKRKEGDDYDKEISIARAKDFPFSSWLLSLKSDDLTSDQTIQNFEHRSDQIVSQAYFNKDEELLGYVELSQGPAFGRAILQSVTIGWASAGFLAVIIAALAGMWVSKRFSTPVESLAKTTQQMAEGNLSARSQINREDEFGHLANSFNQMAENVEDNVSTLKRFVADAAHELGTPLTALRANLELINDPEIPSVLEQVNRMDALTNGLLNLSRFETLETEVDFEDVDLAELLEELVEPFASRTEQAGLEFAFEVAAVPCLIRADRALIRILIDNLVDNAIKFTPKGGKVHVRLSKEAEKIKLAISDTGIGILAEDYSKLYSRFFRGRNTANIPGSGLGLAIAKAIADYHGAEIQIGSESEGTIVLVKFKD